MVLVVDCSSSMRGLKSRQARERAIGFAASALAEGLLVGVASFADDARLQQRPVPDRGRIERALGALHADGATNLVAGLAVATQVLGRSGPRTIVIFSDGISPKARDECFAAADDAKLLGIEIVCSGTGDADLGFLGQLASVDASRKTPTKSADPARASKRSGAAR